MKREYRVKLKGEFTVTGTSPKKANEFVRKLIKNEDISDKDFEMEVSLIKSQKKDVGTKQPKTKRRKKQ